MNLVVSASVLTIGKEMSIGIGIGISIGSWISCSISHWRGKSANKKGAKLKS